MHQVCALLDGSPPASQGWEDKVRDERRCGLVKAVCKEDGSFEWVAPNWKDAYAVRGRALLGMSDEQKNAEALD